MRNLWRALSLQVSKTHWDDSSARIEFKKYWSSCATLSQKTTTFSANKKAPTMIETVTTTTNIALSRGIMRSWSKEVYVLLIAAMLQIYNNRCEGWTHRLPSSSSRHPGRGFHQKNRRLEPRIISLEALFDDENAYNDMTTNKEVPENRSQELQQKLAELLAAEATKAKPGKAASIGSRQPPPQIPDLTAFQKIVDQNAAGGKKTPSIFEETSAMLSTPNESQDNSFDNQRMDGNGELKSMPRNSMKSPTNPIPTNLRVATEIQVIDDEDDGFFLAPDIYERSRDLMSADGSLDLGPSDGDSANTNSPQDMKSILEGLLASSILEEETASSDLDPYNSNGKDNEEDDWDQVWAAIQKEKEKPFDARRSEELHKQVFEEEQGFLEQSQPFRDGLTDPEVAKTAAAERRSAKYRQRQAKAQAQLEQNMLEFEKVWRERPAASINGPETCSRCRCKLSERDYDNNILPQLWMKQQNLTSLCESCYINLLKTSRNMEKRLPGKDSPSRSKLSTADSRPTSLSTATSASPRIPARDAKKEEAPEISSTWEEVEDPDTGEVFYWNEETDEVRWEIE